MSIKAGTVKGKSPWYLAKKRFLKNIPAVAGLIFLVFCILLSVFAYVIIPDKTTNANFQILEFAKKAPGSHFDLLLKPKPFSGDTYSSVFWILNGKPDLFIPVPIAQKENVRIREDSLFYPDLFGADVATLLPEFMLNIDKGQDQTLDWIRSEQKPYQLHGDQIRYVDLHNGILEISLTELQSRFNKSHISSVYYLLGSDAYGRDVFSRLVLGTRVSLSVGLLAVVLSLILGIGFGSLAGFFRGRVDTVILWLVSVIWSIPTLLLAISLALAWESLGWKTGFWNVFVAIGVSMWVEVARIVRGQIFTIREMEYIEATRSLGYGNFRTIWKHVLPNIMSPVVIIAAANFAAAILIEAGLSFLGVGVKAPVPSWGTMIREGYTFIIFESGKWLAFFPGLAIVLVVISLNLVGFGLRDALDPKMD